MIINRRLVAESKLRVFKTKIRDTFNVKHKIEIFVCTELSPISNTELCNFYQVVASRKEKSSGLWIAYRVSTSATKERAVDFYLRRVRYISIGHWEEDYE